MKRSALGALLIVSVLGSAMPVPGADDSRVNAATRRVEKGAQKIGEGKIGEGVEEMARGIGNTVVEGAKFTGEKFKEAGQAAKPEAKSAWEGVRDGAISFGRGVRTFFVRLFSD